MHGHRGIRHSPALRAAYSPCWSRIVVRVTFGSCDPPLFRHWSLFRQPKSHYNLV